MHEMTLAALNASFVHTACGARTLKSYMPERDIKLLELTINQPFEALRAALFENLSPVVGFSCYIWNITLALRLARTLKAAFPHVKTVFGGPEVSFDAQNLLEDNPCVDCVITGPGEEALLAVLEGRAQCRGVINGSDFPAPHMPGIVYDINDLPQPPRILYYESSRGCPFRCGFCLSGGDKLTLYDADKAIQDLTYLAGKNVRQVKLVDRTFNASPERARHIWRALARLETGTNFHFEIEPSLLTDECMDVLKSAPPGRFQLEIGVQTTNPETLSAIGRKNDMPKLLHIMERLRGAGIHIHLDLIAGLPREDMASFARSFDDVAKLRPDMLQLGFLKLLKGSRLRDQGETFGAVYANDPPYEILATDCVSPLEMLKLKYAENALDRFYNREKFVSIEYLARSGSAFELFMRLGEAMAETDCTKMQNALEILLSVAHNTDKRALMPLLQYDWLKGCKRNSLLFEEPLTYQEEAAAFYRTRARELVRCDPRLCHRHCHLQRFECDIFELIRSGNYVSRPVWALFDYVDNKAVEITL